MNQQQAIEAMNSQVTSFFNEKLFKQSTCHDMQILANMEMLEINNILKMGIEGADMDYLTAYQQDCLIALITYICDYYENM